jgi:hypothetical protein
MVSAWLNKYPLQTYEWGSDFDDIPTYSNTEINADTIAAYLLNHPEWDPQWKTHARGILDWVEHRPGNHNFEELQGVPVDEKTVYSVRGNSHTSPMHRSSCFTVKRQVNVPIRSRRSGA